ncbi:hypothetical protein SAMN04489864_1053 [Pedobacter insulae]|uniref:Uncharacterized protein n=1 Tax=Pedobacter insulae TaxID=414048 RepID=A0A1I2X9C5_9SPHI|nr:hypothetical protein SAMN04489864_1053 [Pedobacter insulae]
MAVKKIVGESTNAYKVKDSTAIYSYTITINVQREKNMQKITTSINNPEVQLFFDGMEKLKEIDYLPLMGKRKKMTFFFSTYLLVYGSESNRNTVNLSEVPKAIRYLFIPNKNEMYDLGEMGIKLDKKVYYNQ